MKRYEKFNSVIDKLKGKYRIAKNGTYLDNYVRMDIIDDTKGYKLIGSYTITWDKTNHDYIVNKLNK